MWLGSGFSGFTLFGLFKNKLLLERDREKCSIQDLTFPQDNVRKKAKHLGPLFTFFSVAF